MMKVNRLKYFLPLLVIYVCYETFLLPDGLSVLNLMMMTKPLTFHQKFQLLKHSIRFDETSCFSCLIPGETPGLRSDAKMYRQILTNSSETIGSIDTVIPSKIQLYLENSNKRYRSLGNRPVWLMANLEFFEGKTKEHNIHIVLAKTKKSVTALRTYRKRTNSRFGILHTGHTSTDVFDPILYRQDYSKFAHIAGNSQNKNTPLVIETWLKHPEWPRITIVARSHRYKKYIEAAKNATNIDFLFGFLDERKLVEIQNTHGIHICPSKVEGFGHYINEARSAEALVLSTNTFPMNELVHDKVNGVLIGSKKRGFKRGIYHTAPVAQVGRTEIEKGVDRILSFSIDERQALGLKGRALYLEERRQFYSFLTTLKAAVCDRNANGSQLNQLKPYLF